ncbi:hypothetical protein, partial [Mycobacterium tuberculosis]
HHVPGLGRDWLAGRLLGSADRDRDVARRRAAGLRGTGRGSGSPSNGLVPESYGAVTYAYVIVAINNS